MGPSCFGSPERTTRVLSAVSVLIAAVSTSGSEPCPASSMKMCVKWPAGIPMLYGKDACPHVDTITLYVTRLATGGSEKWLSRRVEYGRRDAGRAALSRKIALLRRSSWVDKEEERRCAIRSAALLLGAHAKMRAFG